MMCNNVLWNIKPPYNFANCRSFLERGLQLATELFENPTISVLKVQLERHPAYPFTNLLDPARGEFRIGVTPEKEDSQFFFQVAQEIPHLFNAELYDWYVEGLNMWFAGELFRDQKMERDWADWEPPLEAQKNDHDTRTALYALSYYMMREVIEKIGRQYINTFLGNAVLNSTDGSAMHIAIDNWITELPVSARNDAHRIILRYFDSNRTTISCGPSEYSFLEPTELKP